MRRVFVAFLLLLPLALSAADVVGPKSPREERGTFQIVPGFQIDLVASEPEVVDPVALAFDEHGRLFVAEMRGYPNEGVATGQSTSGKIKCLEDRDGDGVFETSRVVVDGLRFPTGVMPYKGGLIVTDAPDILYFKDGQRRVLYTGFALHNIQQLVNSPQWGLDNRIYCHAGSNGGTITCPERNDVSPLGLGYRGVRFRLEDLSTLEPTSSGGQYGLSPDDYQRYFTSTNSQHLRHIVLPDHYLRRNPTLTVPAVTLDIPDHGAVCKLFRISPFEPWRVERTRRRRESADAPRFAATELVPGGFTTSGCGAVVCASDLFPPEYRGSTFVCDPANNLIHRDVLEAKGATFVAQRGETDREFLASTDNWFRPVAITVGPDGALYVLDFYREAIETPLSLPDDIKKSLNLQSRQRGRVWRIAPTSPKRERGASPPSLALRAGKDLVDVLDEGNVWRRLTAQRLLVERQDKTAIESLKTLARAARTGPGRAHALWTLRGLNALDDDLVLSALKDTEPGVREQGLRLAEEHLPASLTLRQAVAARADDPSPRVRFQAALSCGAADAPELVVALAKLAERDGADVWAQSAILSSSAKCAAALLEDRALRTAAPAFVTRLAAVVGARNEDGELARALALLGEKEIGDPWKTALLAGLGQGMQNAARPLSRLWAAPPVGAADALAKARPYFDKAERTAHDPKATPAARVAALRLLAGGPTSASSFVDLLTPQTPAEVQLAALRALATRDGPDVGPLLLAGWNAYGPELRREALESLFARPTRTADLLAAVEAKRIAPNQIEPARVEALRKHADATIRSRAQKLFAGATPDRKKVVDNYRSALELKSDEARGKETFRRVCATCHRLDDVGTEVGPDLRAALTNKTPEQLLSDILDPSRDVDSRYINYLIELKNGRTLTGLIAAETATSLTLRRAEKAEDIVLRGQIDTVTSTSKSLMPEGLEQQLTQQDVADLIAYLRRGR